MGVECPWVYKRSQFPNHCGSIMQSFFLFIVIILCGHGSFVVLQWCFLLWIIGLWWAALWQLLFYLYRLQPNMKCIIFVNRIVTARSLSYVLQNLKFLTSWNCDFLVGVHCGLRSVSRKSMNDILEKFRTGKVMFNLHSSILSVLVIFIQWHFKFKQIKIAYLTWSKKQAWFHVKFPSAIW